MDNSGQISAPGSLQAGAVIAPDAPRVPDQDLGELARQHGLKLSGARPSLSAYLAMLWQRRHFIIGYATARNVSMYTDAKLGQIWQVLTPLLNAGVYYLIFGLLFEAARGVANYPAFLVAGVFVFAFSERSIVTGSNVMRANLQLIRALYFPRASLPLAYVIVELQQMLVGMVRARRHHAGDRRVSQLVLAAADPGRPAADAVQHRGGADRRPARRLPRRRVRADPVLPADLPVLLRRHVPDHHAAGRADHRGRSWSCRSTRSRSTSRWSGVAFMGTYRADSAGNQPYNAGLCHLFTTSPGLAVTSSRYQGADHADRPEQPSVEHRDPRGQQDPNNPLQAYCHAIVTNNDLWIAAVGWGVVFFVIGIVFFWRAEHLYGRG